MESETTFNWLYCKTGADILFGDEKNFDAEMKAFIFMYVFSSWRMWLQEYIL